MIEEGHCKGYVCGVWGLEKNISTACIALHCIAARWKWATDVLLSLRLLYILPALLYFKS